MKPEHFRRFVFENPVRFYTDTNPEFFAETVLADDVQRMLRVAEADSVGGAAAE